MPDQFVKRGRFKIVYDILTRCQKPALKTRVLYGCNMSTSQLERYLTWLVFLELLELEKGEERRLYRTTSKGMKFIAHYKYVTSLVTSFDGILDRSK